MKYIGIIGLAISGIVNLAVGLRMLLLSMRTRRQPELMLAILLLVGGVGGLAILNTAQRVSSIPADAKPALAIVGVGCQYLGSLAQLQFAWRVFRPGQRWAGWFYLAFMAAVVAGYVVDIVSGVYIGYASGEMPSLHYAYGFAMRNLTAIALVVESVIFLGKLKRQLRIGLTEPDVVERVRYWVVAWVSVATLYTIGIIHRLATGESASSTPWAIGTMGLLAFVAGVSLYLAFFKGRAAAAGEVSYG